MRINVSTIGTPVYGLSQYLVKVIQHSLNKNQIRLKNSIDFVEKAKQWTISESETQVSYDEVNLYPSVPIKDAINVVINLLNDDQDYRNHTKLSINEIKSLIELSLSKCYFLWDDKIYEFKNAGPIGLSLMVVMAEAFLQYIENKAIQEAMNLTPPIDLKSYHRYVDDSHARFSNINEAEKFKDILNKQNKNIQYTIEYENENKTLNFLDLSIINTKNGKYDFNIYRKEAITNVQIKTTSSHNPKILEGVFKGFIHRAFNLCSQNYIEQEIEFLVKVFVENGYERKELMKIINEMRRNRKHNCNITNKSQVQDQTITLPWIPKLSPKLKKNFKKAGYQVVFKSQSNLRNILTSKNKCSLPANSNPGVYKITCSCDNKPYIGETKIQVRNRVKQHMDQVEKGNHKNSALAFHAMTCKEGINWDKAETIKIERNKFQRKVREALEIQKNRASKEEGGLNLDQGQYVNTKFWLPFFQYLEKASNKKKT